MGGRALLVKPGALNVIDNVAVEASGSQVVATAVGDPSECMGPRVCESPLNSVAVYPPVRGAWCGGASADAAVQPAVTMWGIGASSVVERERRLFVPFSVVLQVDGLMSALLRLRIERDVFATAAVQSACKFYGWERWRSCVDLHRLVFYWVRYTVRVCILYCIQSWTYTIHYTILLHLLLSQV